MSENILILGATSGIASALCARLAARGCNLVLVARKAEELERLAADLRIRYPVVVATQVCDVLAFDQHEQVFQQCVTHAAGRLDGVILCFGYLPDQKQAEHDFTLARRTIDVNFTAAVSLLNLAADYLEKQKTGYIAAISSVAGDRGRQSNYLYGAAKAGLSTYLDGLRNRLTPQGIHVLSIKPGFVDTAMTQGLVNPSSPLMATPERVARDIDRALRRRRNTLYTPWFWRGIMAIIRAIPEPLFKRLRL